MNDSEFAHSKTVPIKIERLMTEIEKLREEELNTTTAPNLSDHGKELDHDTSTDGLSLLPRIGPRSREEKIIAYEEEINRIVHEMNIDQCNLEYYESQERHYKGELDKLEQKNYPDPMAEVLKDHFIDELDRIQYEMFSKLGTGAEQTLRKKLRAVRIDNIGFQLSRLKPKRLSQEDLSPDSETKFLENEDSNGSFFPDNKWTLDDSFAASPAPSSVSISSYSRPWLRDHPASDVSAPHSQINTGSLPRPQSIKGKGEALQEKFKRIQHSLLPSTASTVPMAAKFRNNSHRRSSSITKMNGESSPGSSAPHRPMPVCPIRSKSLTGADMAISGTRDSTGERLNSSIDKGDLKEARSSLASSEERRQASLLSGLSDATDEVTSNGGPYSPARLSITDSDNIQDITESVQSILAKYDSNDYESFALTLQSVTHSPGHVRELFKRGVMEKLIRLLHGLDERRRFVFHNDLRERMTDSLYNIVRCIYSADKLALQIHHNVTMVRDQCQRMLLNMAEPENIDQNELHSIRENISTGPFSQLSAFSYKHETIASLTNLGVLYAMSEYLVVDQRIVERLSEKDEPKKLVYIKRLIVALLRNLTYLDHKNKVSICLLPEVMESLISQLDSSNEELLNSTASLLRNLAWNAEDVSKVALTKCNAIVGLVRALQRDIKQDGILVNITNGLVNLTQHSPDNKILFCAAPMAVQYMIKFLAYKSPDGNSMVIENITGLFCNVSQHIASTLDHMETIQQQGALNKLVSLLNSENNFVLMHVCGILNNLSASNPENVETLWKLRTPQYLEELNQLDNSIVSERAGMVLKHLITMKDGLEEVDRDNCLLNGVRMESVQDASLAFDVDDINFNFEPEFSSPVHKPKIEVTKVRVKDGSHTPVKGDKMREEDLLASTEKVHKYKDSLKRSLFKKISSIRKSSNPMDFEKAPNMQEVRFSLDTSPKRGSVNSDTRSGSQSSVKTLVTNSDTHTPQNSPRRLHYHSSPFSHPHTEAYSHMIHANDVIPQYPYPNSYQSYPHHLIDPPTQPPLAIAHSPHIGYMHHYMPNYHQPHRYHHPLYSPHGSPSKHVPHAYDSSLPLRPGHFPHPHIIPYRQQPYRMPGNPQPNQISRHDAAIIQARLDKYSKDRSYTDSQGDLVTDL